MTVKEKFGKIVSSRAFYIIFSILASLVLWLFIEFTQNQDERKRIENVPVVFINEDILHDKGLVPTSKSPEFVTLTYEGKNSDLMKLTETSLSVTVDLAGITAKGYNPMTYRPVLPADVSERSVSLIQRSVERITIWVDNINDKVVPVEGRYDGGTTSEEFVAGTPEFSPNSLLIRGPRDIVSQIEKVWVPITRTNLSATYTGELDFVLLDVNGEELDESLYESLTFEPNITKIRATVPIRMLKEVPLTVNLMYGSGATEMNSKYTVTPSKITLSGEPDVIKDYNSITLGTIDLTKFDLTDTFMFPIIVENNFINESGVTEALVTAEIMGCEVRRYPTENLSYVKTPPGYAATIRNQSVDVRVRGKPEELDALVPANIWVVADLTDYSPGTAQIPAKVYIDGETGDIGAVGEYTLTVTIAKE